MFGSIRLLSGGAAQGLVKHLQDAFAQQGGFAIRGAFGAVGTMRDKLLAGEACDLVILTQALVEQLAADGHVVASSITPIGRVMTGVAVRAGDPKPDVSSAAALKRALLAAEGVYFPDGKKATAGIHFMKVIRELGLEGELAGRMHDFPNGAAAMRELAHAPEKQAIGCTQVTEILPTPGVQLVGVLPAEFELATVYTAGVCTKAREPAGALAFARLLAAPQSTAAREASGFEKL